MSPASCVAAAADHSCGQPGPTRQVDALVAVDGLTLATWNERGEEIRLLDDLSLSLRRGEALGIIGESGSGKSLLVRSIFGLLPKGVHVAGGAIQVDDTEITSAGAAQLQALRGSRMGMVFQDSIGSLDPLFKIGSQLVEAIRSRRRMPQRQALQEGLKLLADVGITDPNRVAHSYPHELSGGMAQRVAIAIAICNSPSLLIADEATTALDVTIQAQVIELIKRVQSERHCAIIFVSHNLAAVAGLVDRVVVMYAGRIVEIGSTRDVLLAPRHPYTAALLKSRPQLGERNAQRFYLPGNVPAPGQWPDGCRFSPRCTLSRGRELCSSVQPALDPLASHGSACHFRDEMVRPDDALR
ncbi:ABC transporter ATP-binding protein [Candidimonas nitroreducens]|uniref:ABC transporter ATP-binding protein n=1 Tax=Candidimonas nitroreducens TaxID=683354 RepID=UPI001303EB24|nr:ABC transporter ATP-binding protein [Candidimonas nitroreducens]